MRTVVVLVVAAMAQASATFDVSSLTIGRPTTVTELDFGKLKGEPRQLSWAPDGRELYLQTADGDKPEDGVHSYIVSVPGDAEAVRASSGTKDAMKASIKDATRPPDWAAAYWLFKSDRTAPGVPALIIDLAQSYENIKIGTGGGAAADRTVSPTGGDGLTTPSNLEKTAESQKQHVFRLTLLGEAIGEWVNTRPIPGQTFSWGPNGSGAIAYVDRDGRLLLLDQSKHKRSIGVKEATLPAWTTDGGKLAYLQKSGRKKYMLAFVTVAK